jgi:hypothetical protein
LNNITVTEFKDIRVLTTQQLADQYETDSKTISNNFNRNKDRYQEGKHYILLQGAELKEFKASHQFDEQLKFAPAVYLWTEKGCLLQAKSLGTDKAWETYENLVDTYFAAKDMLTGLSTELKAIFLLDKKVQAVMEHKANMDKRMEKLENNMTIDYGQQQVIKEKVASTVVRHLGGKTSNAYKEMSKIVFSECNKDIQHYFNVNSRNNLPKIKFDDAIKFIESWEPAYLTKINIQDTNNQVNISDIA